MVMPYGNKWLVKISLGPSGWGTDEWECFGETPGWNGRWMVHLSSVCCCFGQIGGGAQGGVKFGIVEVGISPLVGNARIGEFSLSK